jgi:hypothetical protein
MTKLNKAVLLFWLVSADEFFIEFDLGKKQYQTVGVRRLIQHMPVPAALCLAAVALRF